MGRRLRFASEFEVWRSEYRSGLLDRYSEAFVDEAMAVLAEEVEAFGPDDRALLAVIVEGRALVQRGAA